MFKVNKQLDYAIQLLGALADFSVEKPLSLKKFSENSGISFLFLQRIASKLKTAELISATHGVQGGYYLIHKPESITVKDIVEAMEGHYGMVDCEKNPGSCPQEGKCLVQTGMSKMNDQVVGMLAKMTVRDLIT